MTVILALDPGSEQTGWVLFSGIAVTDCGVHPNDDVRRWVREGQGADILAIEMMRARGQPVSNDSMRTLVWVGRFMQSWRAPDDVKLVYREDVKLRICGRTNVKDPNVRQALIDMFPPTGGGAVPQVGTKAMRGPLYGMASHTWPALGVAVTVAHQLGTLKVQTEGPLFEQRREVAFP